MGKSNAIGTGAVVITANADQLQSGLQKAGADVNKWASSVQSKASQSAGSGGGSGIIGMLMGGVKAHPVIAGITAGLALAAVGVHQVVDSIKELAAVGKQAETLGIAPERFMGLGLAAKKAGVEQEQFSAILGKLGARVSLAASGNDEFAATFNRLGLNANALRGLSLDQQFLAVADAIGKLPTAGDRAAAAMKLFEEGGLKLLPMFSQGSAKLEEFIKKQQEMGTALDGNQMEAVMNAKKAISGIWDSLDGLWNKIVVAAAPVVELIGNKLKAAMEALQPVLNIVASFVDGTFFIWAAVLEDIAANIQDVFKWMGELIGVTVNWQEITMLAGHAAIAMFGALVIAGSAFYDTMKAGAGAVVYVNSYLVDSFANVVTALKSVLELAKQLPEDLRPTWINDMVDGIERFEGKVREAGEGMRGWGKKQIEGFGQGIARTEAWIDDLHRKLDQKNQKKAKEAIAAGVMPLVPSETKFSAAMLQGSQEAYKLQMQNNFRDIGLNDPGNVNKQQLDEAKKQTITLKELLKIQKKNQPEEAI